MKINNYIVACLSKDWKSIYVNGILTKIYISCLLYQTTNEKSEKIYLVNSRISTTGESQEIDNSNKTYINSNPNEALSFINSLFSNLKISSYNIFKFNSNEDYPEFVKWFKEKQSEAALSLEK